MNKKVFQIGLLVAGIILALPFTTFAVGSMVKKPVGGKVTLLKMPGVTCAAAAGPFFIIPYNGAPAGPYIIPTGTNGIPKQNGFIIGLYGLVPNMTSCYTETTPPVPVTVFSISPVYAVSQ